MNFNFLNELDGVDVFGIPASFVDSVLVTFVNGETIPMNLAEYQHMSFYHSDEIVERQVLVNLDIAARAAHATTCLIFSFARQLNRKDK